MNVWRRIGAVTPGRARRQGFAMVAILIVVIGITAVALAASQVGIRHRSEAVSEVDERRAFYLAEAGLVEGMHALRFGATGNVGSQATPAAAGEGAFWVTATDLGDGTTRLEVTAAVGEGRMALQAVVAPPDGDPLFFAVLNSQDTLTLNSDVMVDSFDSEVGTYVSQVVNNTNGHDHAGFEGDVTSNAGIILNSHASVIGDATPGPGYSVSFSNEAYVHGSTLPSPEPFVFPPITVPVAPLVASLDVPQGTEESIPSGSYYIPTLSIQKDATLEIEGPATLVVDDFQGLKDANLLIDATSGPVSIYVQQSYTHLNGFEAQPVEGSPMALAFFIEAQQDIVFPAFSKVRGAYYSPNADIVFANDNEAWGAFAANKISMSSTMRFHYDETLSKHWEEAAGKPEPPEVLFWQPTTVGSDDLRTDRRDPFVVLDVDPQGLPHPADAWDL